jgi:hypothetical protein
MLKTLKKMFRFLRFCIEVPFIFYGLWQERGGRKSVHFIQKDKLPKPLSRYEEQFLKRCGDERHVSKFMHSPESRYYAFEGNAYLWWRVVHLFGVIGALISLRSDEDSVGRLIRVFMILAWIVPKMARRTIHEPAMNDLLSDYLMRTENKKLRRLLVFGLVCNAVALILECFYLAFVARAKSLLLALMPTSVRRFLSN